MPGPSNKGRQSRKHQPVPRNSLSQHRPSRGAARAPSLYKVLGVLWNSYTGKGGRRRTEKNLWNMLLRERNWAALKDTKSHSGLGNVSGDGSLTLRADTTEWVKDPLINRRRRVGWHGLALLNGPTYTLLALQSKWVPPPFLHWVCNSVQPPNSCDWLMLNVDLRIYDISPPPWIFLPLPS